MAHLVAANGQPLDVLGEVNIETELDSIKSKLDFAVVSTLEGDDLL